MTDQKLKTKHLWYFMKSGLLNEHQEGPFEEPAFIKLAMTGSINGDTKISSPTRTKSQWVFAKAIPVLMAKVNEGKINREAEKKELNQEKTKQQAELSSQKAATKSEAAQQKRIVAEQVAAEAQLRRQQLAAKPTAQFQTDQSRPAPQVAPPFQQTIVIQQRQSNTVPVLLNMFLWPGLGQLVQGRALAGIFLTSCWLISILLMFVIIGFFIAPVLWFVALIDAAMYRDDS